MPARLHILLAAALASFVGCTSALDLDTPLVADVADICVDCDTSASCSDGIQNGDESGIDCGGICAHPCRTEDECSLGVCTESAPCASPMTCQLGCCEVLDESCDPVGIACSTTDDCGFLGASFVCDAGCCAFELDDCGDASPCRTNAACGVDAFCDAGCCRAGGPGAPCEGAAADGSDLTEAGECNRDFTAYDTCDAGIVARVTCPSDAYCNNGTYGAECVAPPGAICKSSEGLLTCTGNDPACVEYLWDGLTAYTCVEGAPACAVDAFTPHCEELTLDGEPHDVLMTQCRYDQQVGIDCATYGGSCDGRSCYVGPSSACDGALIRCEVGTCSGMVTGDDGEVLVWGQCPAE